jgi:hypothetical protein
VEKKKVIRIDGESAVTRAQKDLSVCRRPRPSGTTELSRATSGTKRTERLQCGFWAQVSTDHQCHSTLLPPATFALFERRIPLRIQSCARPPHPRKTAGARRKKNKIKMHACRVECGAKFSTRKFSNKLKGGKQDSRLQISPPVFEARNHKQPPSLHHEAVVSILKSPPNSSNGSDDPKG